jgi:hypothetical protein
MIKHMGHLFPPATSIPKRNIWSRFGISADVEHASEPATVHDIPLTTQHTSTQKKNPWTRTHSHFALMGGFAVEVDATQANFLPNPYTRLTLAPCALRKLAEVEPTLITGISERAIKDKSKASWLAKSLACLQACWFIVQVIGRAATSAPISLLEMNTFLHALCTLVIYLAWWHKPLDIEEPEVIKATTEHTRSIIAWMIMQSDLSCVNQPPNEVSGMVSMLVHSKDLFKKNSSERACHRFNEDDLPKSGQPSSNDGNQLEVHENTNSNSTAPAMLPGQVVYGFYLIRNISSADMPREYLYLNPEQLECLRLADLLRKDSGSDDIWEPDRSDTSADMVLTHASNYDLNDDTLTNFRGSTILTQRMHAKTFPVAIALLTGSIYGLVHLIAWNGPFTSYAQRYFWRTSCILVAIPALGATFATIPDVRLYLFPDESSHIYADFFFEYVYMWMWICMPLAYGPARIFLIVECFINISQLPPEVYKVPQWSQYIPHLGGG